jgi:hypothetical protein
MSRFFIFMKAAFSAAPVYAPSLDFSDDRNSQYWMFFI